MKIQKHLSAEQHLLHLIYTRTATMAVPMGEFSTWLVTGTAAILGAILVNVEAVSNVLSSTSLRWGLAFLVISMLCGIVARQMGVAMASGLQLVERLEDELTSPEGELIIDSIKSHPQELKSEMASAFLPPLRGMMERSFERGGQDPLAGDKRLIKIVCIQVYVFWAQGITGAIGLLTLGFGI